MEATETGTSPPVPGDIPWGIAEIARWHGVQRATVDHWRSQKNYQKLPKEDGTVSGRPWWWRSTIRGLAIEARQDEAVSYVAGLAIDTFLPGVGKALEDTAARGRRLLAEAKAYPFPADYEAGPDSDA